ncbi:MAG: phosphatidylglycerophosphatase A [Deltaproteobacteria bacterium]|nr:phosphatidylglycerophosphatase A [Deltaproteobacteria bacterium]
MSRESLILLLATWFGVGKLPVMPGTWGSLAAVPLWWLLSPLGPLGYGLAVLLLGGLSVYVCGQAEMYLRQTDASVIVLDEVLGQLIALAACPRQIYWLGLGVLLFRLFDIIKPFPIGFINDHVGGGLGIVLDDVVAGLFAGLILWILIRIFPS